MDNYKYLKVFYNDILVGTLAKTPDRVFAFEYDLDWLNNGFSVSPFSLPLIKKVFIPKYDPFGGLFGVFNDSLPDGWGRLLVDRLFLKNKINPAEIDNLNRLAVVQESGMGALTYKPEHRFESENSIQDYDILAQECSKILESQKSENLDELFKLGGSSGGARPKILTSIDNEDWIIKFPSSSDPKNIGEKEYQYSLCAKNCGIYMTETRLFPSKICSGYFGIKRFDRKNGKKVHMVSASGLLETSHRFPNLDYNTLMKLTLELTRNYQDIEQLFRLMCFNVFAHNRDDHSKNFSFLFDDTKKEWHLSPAYDLTYSFSFNGEHATTINGEGKNPTLDDILAVAKNIGIKEKFAKGIASDIKEKCSKLFN
ncbi:TPA: type II toxin-antitoxin system HipA family toxin [Candidatus Galligastranaerophilus intestinavium]|uniref:Type II toxin-antitoxin system HipA family toxin n=1 Tax=Candidatus Galligastranaerophilus intestinavium TaxID=2840836 RepID=A0A9D1FIK4_9BACT|nr:type II toxin-antitoxin system HipA family toxin [Candidatus Galligastranaerophilus intestinavium]